jgi:2-polyprenyl-3-methyl-5-hydroxy-6-metoxy-1,4-benzoquinol methylase
MPQMTDRTREMDERAWWDLWNSSYRSEDNKDEISSELFSHVSALVNDLTKAGNCSVLEIACGTGSLSRLLDCSSYHGLDISPAAIKIACEKSALAPRAKGTSTTYEAADFHEWSLPPVSFDVAICVDAVMCFRDQQFVLNKIAQSLRTHGKLVLTAINPLVYNRIKRTQTVRLENGPVSHWVSHPELHTLVETAGLSFERSYTIMPRGNRGILRVINSRRVNQAFGAHGAAVLRRLKEQIGLGQYRVIVARKL